MKKVFKNTLTAIAIVGVMIFGLFPSIAHATPAEDACTALESSGTTVTCDKATSNKTAGSLGIKIVDTLSLVVGSVAVIMLIIGGFRYVVSAGDSNGVQGAKNTILYALVGLAIVIFAQVIVKFVIGTLTS